MQQHNHEVLEYKTKVHQLKTKCKTVAKQVQSSSLRQVFDDVARNNPCAREITLQNVNKLCIELEKLFNPKFLNMLTNL